MDPWVTAACQRAAPGAIAIVIRGVVALRPRLTSQLLLHAGLGPKCADEGSDRQGVADRRAALDHSFAFAAGAIGVWFTRHRRPGFHTVTARAEGFAYLELVAWAAGHTP